MMLLTATCEPPMWAAMLPQKFSAAKTCRTWPLLLPAAGVADLDDEPQAARTAATSTPSSGRTTESSERDLDSLSEDISPEKLDSISFLVKAMWREGMLMCSWIRCWVAR